MQLIQRSGRVLMMIVLIQSDGISQTHCDSQRAHARDIDPRGLAGFIFKVFNEGKVQADRTGL